jgi:hypothetical protein
MENKNTLMKFHFQMITKKRENLFSGSHKVGSMFSKSGYMAICHMHVLGYILFIYFACLSISKPLLSCSSDHGGVIEI